MKKYIISLFFLFLVLISAVSANEINSTDDVLNSDDEFQIEVSQDYLNSNSNNLNSELDNENQNNDNCQNSDICYQSADLIVNHDFSDGLNNWTVSGSVSVSSDGQIGNYVVLSPRTSSISQDVNWSSIEKISFYYKVNSSEAAAFAGSIGSDYIVQVGQFVDYDWIPFELDVSSLEGVSTLKFEANSKRADIYISAIQYVPRYSSENETESNDTSENETESNDLIVNHDFSDGLNGWITKGQISISNEGYNGSCVLIQPGGSPKSSISQDVNWSSIDKLGFYYKNSVDGDISELVVKIGNVVIFNNNRINPDKWTYFEYDTSSIEGIATLSFGLELNYLPAICIDSIKYVLHSDENDTSGNATGGNSTSGNNTNGTSGNNNTNNITKIATKISATNVNMVYNGGKSVIITLKDANGNTLANKKVTIIIDGQSYDRTTNNNGQASISFNLIPKTYTATINFAGDSSYDASSTKATVKITKAAPKLTAKAKTFKIKTKTKKYAIILKNNKGKVLKKVKVTLKVKGKTYKATTNAKGKATFKISKLTKKGTYKAIVKFAGNKYYNSLSKKVKIVVKK